MTAKNTLNRRILASTIKFSRRFPEKINGRPVQGRMDVRQRGNHVLEILKMSVPESELRKWILRTVRSSAPMERDKTRRNKFIEWSVKKYGSKENAHAAIKKIIEDAQKGLFQYKQNEAKRAAQILKLKEEPAQEYFRQLQHLSDSALVIVLQGLFEAERVLRKQ